jgi:hypothetical protein
MTRPKSSTSLPTERKRILPSLSADFADVLGLRALTRIADCSRGRMVDKDNRERSIDRLSLARVEQFARGREPIRKKLVG